MPRSERSKESAIILFFATADLAITKLVMALSKDALKERTDKSDAAKRLAADLKAKAEREAKKVQAAKAAAPAPAKAKAKKSHHKKKAAAPRLPSAPTPGEVEDLDGGEGYDGSTGD